MKTLKIAARWVATVTGFHFCVLPLFASDPVPIEQLRWLQRNPHPLGQGVTGLAASSDCYVAVGGGGFIARSVNGVFWDVIPNDDKFGSFGIRFSEGLFVPTGGGTKVISSTNGLDWKEHPLPPPGPLGNVGIDSIRLTGDRWVIVRNGEVFVSLDGANWEPWLWDLGYVIHMVASPNRLVGTSHNGFQGWLVTATEPGEWTEIRLPGIKAIKDIHYADGKFVFVDDHTIGVSANGVDWELTPSPPGLLTKVDWTGSQWLLSHASGEYLVSPDAMTWTSVPVANVEHVTEIATRKPNNWVAFGDGYQLLTSQDGIAWTRRDRGFAPTQIISMAKFNDRWIGVGTGALSLTSTDGLNWSATTIGENPLQVLRSIFEVDGVLYVLGQSENYRSTDGITWAQTSELPSTAWNLAAIPSPFQAYTAPVWVGDRWLVPTTAGPPLGSGRIYSSADGREWTLVATSSRPITSVAGRPGAYVAAQGSVEPMLFSADAVTWTELSLPAAGRLNIGVRAVLEGDGWFVAGTDAGIIVSPDGQSWDFLPGIAAPFIGGARIGNSFWMTGPGGTIVEVLTRQEAPIANLSTRAQISTNGLPPIAGFVVTGTESLQVLVRAVGKGLRQFDVVEVVEQPIIRLYRQQNLMTEAGDWTASSDRAEIERAIKKTGAFPLAEGDKDAALIATLPPGIYTAIASDSTSGAGQVLLEVYDTESTDGISETGRLVNSSTRGDISLEDPLIGGLVVSGDRTRQVLIRGIGPGLQQFSVEGAATNPMLRIFSGQEVIAENDNWSEHEDPALIADAFAVTSAFSLETSALDAATVLTLAPGLYTVHVLPSAGSSGGVALLEAYFID